MSSRADVIDIVQDEEGATTVVRGIVLLIPATETQTLLELTYALDGGENGDQK